MTTITTTFLIISDLFGSPGHNFIGVYHWPKAIQLMGGPGYTAFILSLFNIKVIQQPKEIQLSSDPGYSFYSMLIQCPNII